MPDGKYLIPGVLDSTSNVIEHPEVVADRLVQYAGGQSSSKLQASAACSVSWHGAAPVLAAPEQTEARVQTCAVRAARNLRGRVHLKTAEAVCAGDGIAREDVLDLLTGLVEKSLVVPEEFGGEARFRLLETMREFGRERLAEKSELPGRLARHAAYRLDLHRRLRARVDSHLEHRAHVLSRQSQIAVGLLPSVQAAPYP